MYHEVWGNINRHLTIIWQAAAVLGGAFGVFAFVDKGVLTIDISTSLVLLIASWLVAHVYDANSWFNRNLVIVANIERQFLRRSDEKDIHFFFTRHRKSGDLVEHLRVQRNLGVGIGAIVLGHHFVTRVLPFLGAQWLHVEAQRALPYLVAAICALWISRLRASRMANYSEFIKKSPGATWVVDE
jgi:hypothetical protein